MSNATPEQHRTSTRAAEFSHTLDQCTHCSAAEGMGTLKVPVGKKQAQKHARHPHTHPAYNQILSDDDILLAIHHDVRLCYSFADSIGYGPLTKKCPSLLRASVAFLKCVRPPANGVAQTHHDWLVAAARESVAVSASGADDPLVQRLQSKPWYAEFIVDLQPAQRAVNTFSNEKSHLAMTIDAASGVDKPTDCCTTMARSNGRASHRGRLHLRRSASAPQHESRHARPDARHAAALQHREPAARVQPGQLPGGTRG